MEIGKTMTTPPPLSRAQRSAQRRAERRRRQWRFAIGLVLLCLLLGGFAATWSALKGNHASPTSIREGLKPSTSTSHPRTPQSSTSTLPALATPGPGYVPGQVTAVGDSVLLDAEPTLRSAIPGIDFQATEGEQWYTGVEHLAALKASGSLGAIIIVSLSTNGPISQANIDSLLATAGDASRIILVNTHVPRDWQDPNNAVIAATAATHHNVVVADWHALSQAHPEWFYGDGIHLPIGGIGASALANLIADKTKA